MQEKGKLLHCPQCEVLIQFSSLDSAGGLTCPHCGHFFRPGTSDLVQDNSMQGPAVEMEFEAVATPKRSWWALGLLVFAFASVVVLLQWGVPALWPEQFAVLPCLSQYVWDSSQWVQSHPWVSWLGAISVALVIWFVVIPLLKGALRCFFYGLSLLLYLGVLAAIFTAIWLAVASCSCSCFWVG